MTIPLTHSWGHYPIEPTDQVLEIGFGTGRAIELAAARATNGYVAGIDVSRTMVDAANRRNQHAVDAGRVRLRSGDRTTLPFSEQRFEKVFSIHTLYFWGDFPRAITELYRVLKPQGRLVLAFATGKVGAVGQTGLSQFTARVDSEILPAMKQIGFTEAISRKGQFPDNSRSQQLLVHVEICPDHFRKRCNAHMYKFRGLATGRRRGSYPPRAGRANASVHHPSVTTCASPLYSRR